VAAITSVALVPTFEGVEERPVAQLAESESVGVEVGGVSEVGGVEVFVVVSAEVSVGLALLRPFSNSVLAEPRFRANFGIADPPKTRTSNITMTMMPSGPSSPASNTVDSFVVSCF
jgi:hypothetical protein